MPGWSDVVEGLVVWWNDEGKRWIYETILSNIISLKNIFDKIIIRKWNNIATTLSYKNNIININTYI